MAIKRARLSVVAGNPSFIRVRRIAHCNRPAPGHAILRPAYNHSARLDDRQRHDEPGAMRPVKSYGRVAHRAVRSACKNGDSRKPPVLPGHATIGGGCEANVGSPAIEKASHLENRYECRAESGDGWLDLGGMLAGWIRKGIGAEPLQQWRRVIGTAPGTARV